MKRGFQYSGVRARARVTGLLLMNHNDLDGSVCPRAYLHLTPTLANNSLTFMPLSSGKFEDEKFACVECILWHISKFTCIPANAYYGGHLYIGWAIKCFLKGPAIICLWLGKC